MFEIDWTNLQLYHYLAFGGGAVAVLALLLYFVMPKGVRIPAGVIGTVAGLVAGVGLGVIGMAASGYQLSKEITDGAPDAAAGPGGGPPGGMKGPPGGMMGGPPGGGMMGGPPGGMLGGKGGGKGKGKGFGAP